MSSKSGSQPKENFESWESLFRKTLSKDRLLSLTRPAENSIQWIHLLDSFDQPDTTRTVSKSTPAQDGLAWESSVGNSHSSGHRLTHLKLPEAVVALVQAAAKASGELRAAGSSDLSGWPLIPFSKMQMFKCEKCCMEFCSPVNHRRHLRGVHRRAVHAEKEDVRSCRQQLASLWDSLTSEEASKIVDVKNLVLEDLQGEKVARALSYLLQQPGLFALPHSYVKSGAMLLDLVQCRSSRLLSSSELFKILDGSSEKTFPSFGLSAIQRYVFEGGAGKVGLEARNLVSSLGFLVELNLVKAFIKDKDEEAWRCQTALVEEEEASQKKRAQMQERKRLKKVRQRDSKEKEQKPSDSTVARISADSDSSEDEELSNSNPVLVYDLQSRPSSNAFENFYHRLADEGSDSDHDEGCVLTTCSFVDDSNHSAGTVIPDASQNNLINASMRNTDSPGKVESEHRILKSGDNDSVNEGRILPPSGCRKPYVTEKRKYPGDRFSGARESFAPYWKNPSKDRYHLSFRNCPGQSMANDSKEGVDLACPEVTSFRLQQFMYKPTRLGKYHTVTQPGAAVWTKKAQKCSNTGSDVSSQPTVSASHANEETPVHIPNVDVPAVLEEDSGVDNFHDSVSASNDSPMSSCHSTGISHQSNLALLNGGIGSQESHPSITLPSDMGHYNHSHPARHDLSTLSSVVVGSVMIGSVSMPLVDSNVGQIQTGMQSTNLEDEIEGRNRVEVSPGEPPGSLSLTYKLEESCRALHENGAMNSLSHKELEKNAKFVKLPPEIDSEEKENHEHSPHLAGVKSCRPTVVRGGHAKGGQLKVWRPIASASFHDSQDRLYSCGPIQNDTRTSSTLSTITDKESSISASKGPEELELCQPNAENQRVCFSCEIFGKESMERQADAVEGSSTVGSISASTSETISCFLSERWSVAVSAPDTVVLFFEDEEEGLKRNEDLVKERNEGIKMLRNPSLQTRKDSSTLPGNGKVAHGVWKQCCPGSALSGSRCLSGKSPGLHGAPRLAGYRYVPK